MLGFYGFYELSSEDGRFILPRSFRMVMRDLSWNEIALFLLGSEQCIRALPTYWFQKVAPSDLTRTVGYLGNVQVDGRGGMKLHRGYIGMIGVIHTAVFVGGALSFRIYSPQTYAECSVNLAKSGTTNGLPNVR